MAWLEWIAIGIGVFGVVLAIIQLWPRTGRFAWIPKRHALLADTTAAPDARLELRHDGHAIPRASQLIICIRNVGRQSIREELQRQPPRITLTTTKGSTPEILSARVLAARTGFPEPKLDVADTAVELRPALWRPGDWADIGILHSGEPRTAVIVNDILIDGKPIKKLVPEERRAAWIQVALIGYMVFTMIWFAAFSFGTDQLTPVAFAPLVPFFLFVFGTVAWESDAIRVLRGLDPLPEARKPGLKKRS